MMRRAGKFLAALPPLLVAGLGALPVLSCPACWPLYAGLLTTLGLPFADYTPYLFPATVFLLAVSLLPLLWKAQSRRGYKPFFTAVAAAVLILWGKFQLDDNTVYYAGIALLLAVSVWSIWPRRRGTDCLPCAVSHETKEL